MRRRIAQRVLVCAMVAGPAATGVPTGASTMQAASEPGYLTISFGRTQWVATAGCRPISNAVALDQVAADMAVRGMAGVGNVVVDRTRETGFLCVGYYMRVPGWDRLAVLRDTYGWSFVSASQTYRDITTLPPDEVRAETCDTLPAFEAHGHDRAWGLFAYARNRSTTQIQRDVVSTCFAYGRLYDEVANHRAAMSAPWFAGTDDVNGGRCNVSARPCATVADAPNAYRSPEDIAERVQVAPGDWLNLQFYRLVRGKRMEPSGDGTALGLPIDGLAAALDEPPELYCYRDFLAILDEIPEGVVVTDPAGVATAWGRVPPFDP